MEFIQQFRAFPLGIEYSDAGDELSRFRRKNADAEAVFRSVAVSEINFRAEVYFISGEFTGKSEGHRNSGACSGSNRKRLGSG